MSFCTKRLWLSVDDVLEGLDADDLELVMLWSDGEQFVQESEECETEPGV